MIPNCKSLQEYLFYKDQNIIETLGVCEIHGVVTSVRHSIVLTIYTSKRLDYINSFELLELKGFIRHSFGGYLWETYSAVDVNFLTKAEIKSILIVKITETEIKVEIQYKNPIPNVILNHYKINTDVPVAKDNMSPEPNNYPISFRGTYKIRCVG